MSDATHPPPGETSGGDRGRLADFPHGRGSSRLPKNNLPLQLTTFVGREREMAEAEGLLVDGTRLLTLTGPGGSGKTRLALAVAAELVENFEDGVWWVELASLSDPDLVPQAVAGALGMREQPGRPLIATLADSLGSKRLLLILDNCEHLIDACAALVRTLLTSCPRLRVLATSREVLGIAGEVNWPVPSLSVPGAADLSPSSERLARYEAVRLFVERARSRLPGFDLTEGNAAAVAEVCRRLDGIPLAIEFAAARVGVLSVEQIAARLADSLKVLGGGSRTAAPRHRTLRAALEWGNDLLSEPERLLFGRLSVFAGGWTLEAAEAVGAGGGIEEEAVLDLLSKLVDKSLVVVEEAGGESGLRYRMLEPVRQYGYERLLESGEAEAVRRRHAEYCLALVEEVEPELMGVRQGTWLDRLETEHANLRVAIRWSLEGEHAELGQRLCGALGEFWHMRGYLSEGRRWLVAALAKSSDAPVSVRAKALARAGWIAWEQGDYERSINLNEESLALYRKAGDEAGVALALHTLGFAEMHRNERERSSALIEEAITLQRALGDTAGIARSLVVLGLLAVAQGDFERAAALHEESVELARTSGDDWAVIASLMVGAFAHLGRGDFSRARALSEEGLELCRRVRMMHLTASHLHVSAVLAGSQGQPARSARLWGAAEALREAIGAYLSPIEHSYYDPIIDAVRTQLGETAFAVAWAEGRAMTPEQAVEYARGELQEAAPLLTQQPTPPPVPASASTEAQNPTAQAPAHLRIFALGGARVEVDEHALTSSDFGYAKPKELLFYLLSHPPRTREQIGLALWPEASISQLRGSFHEALRRLRKALGGAQWIVHENKLYSFNRSLEGHYFFDVEAFEEKLAEAQKVREESAGEAISYLKVAVGLYGGDFLEGFAAGGEWAQVRQEELRRSYQDVLQDLGILLFREGSYSEAAEFYRKIIAMDRYSEVAHREVIRSEARLGERGRALAHYKELVEVLQKELGSSPAPETVALYEGVLRGDEV